MKLDLGLCRLLDQYLDVFGPKGGIPAKKDISDNSSHRFSFSVSFERIQKRTQSPRRPQVFRDPLCSVPPAQRNQYYQQASEVVHQVNEDVWHWNISGLSRCRCVMRGLDIHSEIHNDNVAP
jgi:hypothetical protein